MTERLDERWLDDVIRRIVDTGKPEFDVQKWRQKYPQEYQALLARAKQPAPGGSEIWHKSWRGSLLRVAAVAVLFCAVGYAVGRFSGPRSVDVQKLQADIEGSLRASLEQSIREQLSKEMDRRVAAAVAGAREQVAAEIGEQLRRELGAFAASTLQTCSGLIDQGFSRMVQLIDEARFNDRMRVATALEQMEISRLRDKMRFSANVAISSPMEENSGG
jgi:hypothetical protein